MRVAILPREVAGAIITGSLTRVGWGIGLTALVLTIPVLVETYLAAGQQVWLPLPIALVVLQMLALGAAAWSGRPLVVGAYLAIAAALVVAFQIEVISLIPDAVDDRVFLLNRPAIALVTVGVSSASTRVGIGWFAAGLGASLAATGVTSLLVGVPVRPGIGPTLIAGIGVLGFVLLALIQRRARRRLPNFDALEAETRQIEAGVDLARRTTAVVHDTVLNDLAIIMNGPHQLDHRTRERLRRDLDTLTGADWLSASTVVPADQQDAELRNTMSRVFSDLQWRGLSVQVTGSGFGIYRLAPPIAGALVASVSAALENVLRHAGTGVAEVEITYTDDALTVMVTDQGRGFDPQAVPPDRLGVRESIRGRVEEVGGRVDVWSTPGEGTSVVMTFPVEEVVSRHEPSRHQEVRDG